MELKNDMQVYKRKGATMQAIVIESKEGGTLVDLFMDEGISEPKKKKGFYLAVGIQLCSSSVVSPTCF